MAQAFNPSIAVDLQKVLIEARKYPVIDVNHHVSMTYAELKTDLAKQYLPNASKRRRPRWLEDWVDKTTGRKLGIDENDLWMCAQAKDRQLVIDYG